MMDLERLDELNEALEMQDDVESAVLALAGFDFLVNGIDRVYDAARAYRDLQIERTEPDYEAALRKVLSWLTYLEDTDTPRDRGKLYAMTIEAVGAAIGDKLLVDYPTEEEA